MYVCVYAGVNTEKEVKIGSAEGTQIIWAWNAHITKSS